MTNSVSPDIPIIIAAFGTTSRAIDTYRNIDKALRNLLPEEKILWSYTSRIIGKKHSETKEIESIHPEQLIIKLGEEGYSNAVLQSLHLFPGTEFHKLYQAGINGSLTCSIGMPLLTSPEDYQQFAALLQPIINDRPGRAILVLGHGTQHPAWTAYYSLEKILREKFGKKIFVGVVEEYPDSSHLPAEIVQKGYREVTIIPLFLVSGMHFRRDIIGDSEDSWKSKLVALGLQVEAIDHGIGLLPGIEQIIAAHIMQAKDNLPTSDL